MIDLVLGLIRKKEEEGKKADMKEREGTGEGRVKQRNEELESVRSNYVKRMEEE